MPPPKPQVPRRSGISFWMQAVLREAERVNQEPSPAAVHDLRVALRRCRSIAASFRSLDPDPAWRQMRRAGSELASELGQLRDNHVMAEWLHKLFDPHTEPAQSLLARLAQEEEALNGHVRATLGQFDQEQWRGWTEHLSTRAGRLARGGLVFQHMALERWMEARELHSRALRNRSHVSWHQLRIGLKRLRYTVESFLPALHARWGSDLKHLQDILGEVHDLDVLWPTLDKSGFITDADTRTKVQQVIRDARAERISAYHDVAVGKDSLWNSWRDGLPSGERLDRAGMTVARAWAGYRDPAPQWSARISQLALQLLDAFTQRRLSPVFTGSDARTILAAAAALHAVGKGTAAAVEMGPTGEVRPGHHKSAGKRIAVMSPPVGWDAKRMRLIAFVVRYHRGALPKSEHAIVTQLPKGELRIGMFLAGILRLAEALESLAGETSPKMEIENEQGRVPGLINVRVAGYDPLGPQSRQVAAATYMIETACGVPMIVRPL